jgi:hypothetical protein
LLFNVMRTIWKVRHVSHFHSWNSIFLTIPPLSISFRDSCSFAYCAMGQETETKGVIWNCTTSLISSLLIHSCFYASH